MGSLRRKISHVRFFHGKPPQKNFSREIFSREASAEFFLAAPNFFPAAQEAEGRPHAAAIVFFGK